MKLEMDCNTTTVLLVSFIGLILAAIILGSVFTCQRTNQEAIKAGLVQKQNLAPGTTCWSSAIWVKP